MYSKKNYQGQPGKGQPEPATQKTVPYYSDCQLQPGDGAASPELLPSHVPGLVHLADDAGDAHEPAPQETAPYYSDYQVQPGEGPTSPKLLSSHAPGLVHSGAVDDAGTGTTRVVVLNRASQDVRESAAPLHTTETRRGSTSLA